MKILFSLWCPIYLPSFLLLLVCFCWTCFSQQTGVGDPNLSCFAPYQTDIGALMSATRLRSIAECTQYCYNNPTCKSVVWDEASCVCYQYRQTARQNPAILLNMIGTNYLERTCESSGVPEIAGPGGTPSPSINTGATDCPSARTAYFLTTEVEMARTADSQVTNFSEENECIRSCSATSSCRSISMRPLQKTCVISSGTLPPDGTGQASPNPDAFYLEKLCLPADSPGSCGEQFFYLFPQKNLYENSLSTTYTNSITECAGSCITTSGCKAGVYDSNTKVCVLKKETAVSANVELRPAAATVFYFENGCLLARRRRYRDAYFNRRRAADTFSRTSRPKKRNTRGGTRWRDPFLELEKRLSFVQ